MMMMVTMMMMMRTMIPGHAETCQRSIFSTLFVWVRQRCGLVLPVSCSKSFNVAQKASVLMAVANTDGSWRSSGRGVCAKFPSSPVLSLSTTSTTVWKPSHWKPSASARYSCLLSYTYSYFVHHTSGVQKVVSLTYLNYKG